MRLLPALLPLLLCLPATAAETRTLTAPGAGGLVLHAEAGRIEVPENRGRAGSRRISLPYFRFRSRAAKPGSPVFLLAGGPGASWMGRLEERREYLEEVDYYLGIADVVVFDQRGAGNALPQLDCPQRARLPADAPLAPEPLAAALRGALAACRDHWLAEGIDLAAYNTVENAADVDALRRMLGYPRITLLGGSYGSHLALQVMRDFPETVDRAVLYGIEGPDQTWDDPSAKLATLARIAAEGEQAPELADAGLPPDGLLGVLARVLDRLEREPVSVRAGDGESAPTVLVDAQIVRRIAGHRAGNRDDPLAWPRLLLAMDRGDFSLAARAALAWRDIPLDDPMHWSMDCASGVSPERRRRLDRSPAIRLLGDPNFEYRELCGIWPHRDLGASFRAPVRTRHPVLIIHGDRDTSTPIENAREVAAALPDARLVEVHGGSHGAIYNLYQRWPPMRGRLAHFLAGGDADFPAHITLESGTDPDHALPTRSTP